MEFLSKGFFVHNRKLCNSPHLTTTYCAHHTNHREKSAIFSGGMIKENVLRIISNNNFTTIM